MSTHALLPWLAAALSSAGAIGLVAVAWTGLSARISDHADTLDMRLRYLQLTADPAAILRVQALVTLALTVLAVLRGSPIPACLLPVVWLGPSFWLARKCTERSGLIEQQLDGWLLSLAGTLAATPALGDALASTRKQVAWPLGDELETVLRETELGTPLDGALSHMAARVDSASTSAALTILRVARNTGGNLGKTLESAASNLREMARLEGVVRTKTAEGRAQAFVVSAVPLPLVGGLHALDPGFLAPLWNDPRGHAVLGAAVVLWLLAVIWAQRIVAVEI